MIRTPAHKQTDPAKQAGVIRYGVVQKALLPKKEVPLTPIFGVSPVYFSRMKKY